VVGCWQPASTRQVAADEFTICLGVGGLPIENAGFEKLEEYY